MKPAVLVTDGEQRAALAVVRSLGRAGYAVYVCSTRAPSLAGASRHASGEAVVPDPLRDPTAFAEVVRTRVSSWGVQVIIPVAEPSLLAILGNRDRFAGVAIPAPDLDAFRRVADKALVLREARAVGIGVPEQHVLESPEDVRRLDASVLRFPLVLKPSRSVGEAEGRRAKLSVGHAADAAQLERALDRLPPEAYPLLLQQRVVGPGVGIFLLLWEGRTLAEFSHRRLREKPPSGGGSVYRESIPADPELVERSRSLLERLGWWGVAMVEYKVDAATGTPYLMEINGRFWGSLQLAIDAGVDFPTLLVRAASGEAPEPVTRYRTGVRSRWWWGDVDHLLMRLLRSPEELSLPPGAPRRGRAVIDFLKFWRPGDRNEILRLGDPRPFVHESREWLRALRGTGNKSG